MTDFETNPVGTLAKLAKVEEERDALAAHVEALHEFLRTAPIGSGVCCCGDAIKNHGDPISCGHTPVDEVEYAAHCLMEEAPSTSLRPPQGRVAGGGDGMGSR